MSVQAIAWSPSGAVRIVDQRALPGDHVTRDLDTAEQMAEAIRTLQVRGAPLIGIAAAMGLVRHGIPHRSRPCEAAVRRMTADRGKRRRR